MAQGNVQLKHSILGEILIFAGNVRNVDIFWMFPASPSNFGSQKRDQLRWISSSGKCSDVIDSNTGQARDARDAHWRPATGVDDR